MTDLQLLGAVLLGGSMFAEGFLLCLWMVFGPGWISEARGYWG